MVHAKESSFWRSVRAGLMAAGSPSIHVQRHEDCAAEGIPDVSYGLGGQVQGWIELKVIPGWPRRAETPVRIPHLTDMQKAWLRARGMAGGRCFLLLRVATTDSLLFGWQAIGFLGQINKKEMERMALARWGYSLDYTELASILLHGSH